MEKARIDIKKGKFVFNKISKLKSYFAPMLKLSIALALFFMAALFISGAGVIVEDGALNVSNNLLVNSNTLFVDSASNSTGIGTLTPLLNFGTPSGDFASHTGLHIDGAVNTGIFAAEGDTGAKLVLADSGGSANDKIFEIEVDNGVMTFRSLNDDLSIQNDNMLVLDIVSGGVGFGKQSDNPMEITRSTAGDSARFLNTVNNAEGAQIKIVGNRGTANVAVNDLPAKLIFQGDSTTQNFKSYAVIQARILENTGGSQTGQLEFEVIKDDSELIAMVINGTGSVGIGTTTPTHQLHVIGSQNLTGTLYYGALQAQSPHAFINNDAKSKTEICIVAADGKVVLEYLNFTGKDYEWVFEPNAKECLDKEVTVGIDITYEEVIDPETNETKLVEKSRTEIRKKLFQ